MAGRRGEDVKPFPHVPVKPLIPAIPTIDKEFQELREDPHAMGCDGLLDRP